MTVEEIREAHIKVCVKYIDCDSINGMIEQIDNHSAITQRAVLEGLELLRELLEEYDSVTSSPYYQGDCDYNLIDRVNEQLKELE